MGADSVSERTEITIQTDQLLIVPRRRSTRAWCEKCGHYVDVVALEDWEALARTTHPMLPSGPATEAWHICSGQDGEPRICLESLLKLMHSEKDAELRARILRGGAS